MMGVVYCAFDTSNGKLYVGQTWVGFGRRKAQHINSARNPWFLFQYALRSRADSFVWSVLCEVSTQEELDRAEQHFIHELNAQAPHGYNLTEGGYGSRKSDETKEKIRAKHIGKKLTEEHRLKIGNAARDKKHSAEWRANISRGQLGKRSETRSESMKRAWERRRAAS